MDSGICTESQALSPRTLQMFQCSPLLLRQLRLHRATSTAKMVAAWRDLAQLRRTCLLNRLPSGGRCARIQLGCHSVAIYECLHMHRLSLAGRGGSRGQLRAMAGVDPSLPVTNGRYREANRNSISSEQRNDLRIKVVDQATRWPYISIAEHGAAFTEGQVGGDHQRGPFVALVDRVQQQCFAPGDPGRGPSSEPGRRRNGLSPVRRGQSAVRVRPLHPNKNLHVRSRSSLV